MNYKEYLLVCAGEEAAEVAQAISKCLRFGTGNQQAMNHDFNNVHLVQEVAELLAVLQMLESEGFIDLSPVYTTTVLLAKKDRVRKYAQYSSDIGTLDMLA